MIKVTGAKVRPPRGLNGASLRVAPKGNPGHGADTRQLTLDLEPSIAAPLALPPVNAKGAAIGSQPTLKGSQS